METDGFLLCSRPYCRRCASSPECVTIHHHCFAVFIQECLSQRCYRDPQQAFNRVRDILFYCRPWYKASLIHIRSLHTRAEQDGLSRIVYTSDLAGLKSLPAELIQIIRHLSSYAWLWRFISVWDLARHASVSAQSRQTFALNTIESWKHGDNPDIISDSSKPITRITINSYGIQSIMRLSEWPSLRPSVSRYQAYILDETAELSEIQAYTNVKFNPL